MKMRRLLLVAAIVAGITPAGAQQGNLGANFVNTNQITVGATATKVADYNKTRLLLTIIQLGAVDVFCGKDSTVTTTTGTLLLGTKGSILNVPSTAAVWCIVATGTQGVSFLESYW